MNWECGIKNEKIKPLSTPRIGRKKFNHSLRPFGSKTRREDTEFTETEEFLKEKRALIGNSTV